MPLAAFAGFGFAAVTFDAALFAADPLAALVFGAAFDVGFLAAVDFGALAFDASFAFLAVGC
ncbi:MAG: hypothetical protein R3B40_28645 [Polyangiales bacterium]